MAFRVDIFTIWIDIWDSPEGTQIYLLVLEIKERKRNRKTIEQKDYFIRGLRPRTRTKLIIRDPTTLLEAINMAVKYDLLVALTSSIGHMTGP